MEVTAMWNAAITRRGMLFIKTADWQRLLDSLWPQQGKVESEKNLPIEIDLDVLKISCVPYPKTDKKPEVFNYPLLPIELSNQELTALFKRQTSMLCSSTAYGSKEFQRKSTNEDCALSAEINNIKLAVVSDGVSNGSFFSDRASRIACLAVYKVLSEESGQKGFSLDTDKAQALITRKVRKKIVDAYHADYKELKLKKCIPLKGSLKEFKKEYDNHTTWYKATLLYSCVTADSGFLSVTGDGGVVITGGEGNTLEEKVFLKSEDNIPLEEFISTIEKRIIANRGSLNAIMKRHDSITVYLSTDGVDSSLQRNNRKYSELNIDGQKSIEEVLHELSSDHQPDNAQNRRVYDNYSLAVLKWKRSRSLKSFLFGFSKSQVTKKLQPASKQSQPHQSPMVPTVSVTPTIEPPIHIGKIISEIDKIVEQDQFKKVIGKVALKGLEVIENGLSGKEQADIYRKQQWEQIQAKIDEEERVIKKREDYLDKLIKKAEKNKP